MDETARKNHSPARHHNRLSAGASAWPILHHRLRLRLEGRLSVHEPWHPSEAHHVYRRPVHSGASHDAMSAPVRPRLHPARSEWHRRPAALARLPLLQLLHRAPQLRPVVRGLRADLGHSGLPRQCHVLVYAGLQYSRREHHRRTSRLVLDASELSLRRRLHLLGKQPVRPGCRLSRPHLLPKRLQRPGPQRGYVLLSLQQPVPRRRLVPPGTCPSIRRQLGLQRQSVREGPFCSKYKYAP